MFFLNILFRSYESKRQPVQYDIVDAVSDDEDKKPSSDCKSKTYTPATANDISSEDLKAEISEVKLNNQILTGSFA